MGNSHGLSGADRHRRVPDTRFVDDLLGLVGPPSVRGGDDVESGLLVPLRRALAVVSAEPHAVLLVVRPWSVLFTSELARTFHEFGASPLGDEVSRAALGGVTTHDVVLPGVAAGREVRATALPLGAGAGRRMSPRGVLGALVHYRVAGGALGESELRFLCAIAHAVALRLHCQELAREHAQMGAVLESRVVVEQAKGVLAERWGCAPGEAFAVLRQYARAQRCELVDVCRRVVEGVPGGAGSLAPSSVGPGRPPGG